jgi:SWI/SNF chromatin-remodeling complex subunit SWI1
MLALQNLPPFASDDYLLDRSADRLIAITTILRNFSFTEDNRHILADETVITFICNLVRALGSSDMLVRSQLNTLDLMKDLIILLSNIASAIEIPGPEEAYFLLELILAFAPCPQVTVVDDQLLFAPYDPTVHQYLPHAVDALAKLFARDEPNRTHFRELFSAQVDDESAIPCELLTRAFALAVAPIPTAPEVAKDLRPARAFSLIELRKPLLMQGMLAADIATSLAPGFESGVVRSWLSSDNGLARNIDLLLRSLITQFETQLFMYHHQQQQQRGGNLALPDDDLMYLAALAARLLKRLGSKARDPADPVGENSIPANVIPHREAMLQVLLTLKAQKWKTEGVLTDLLELASLED